MRRLLAATALAACYASGCFQAPDVLVNTELDDEDLKVMTRQMAESIVRCPDIGVKPVVVLFRIRNETNQVLGQVYLYRLRALLVRHGGGRMAFVLSLAAQRQLKAEEGTGGEDDGPDPRLRPTLALMGTFYAHTVENVRGRQDYVLCSFQLVHLRTGAILWEDYYDVKRAATRRWLD